MLEAYDRIDSLDLGNATSHQYARLTFAGCGVCERIGRVDCLHVESGRKMIGAVALEAMRRLAGRPRTGRTEADVQADVRDVLLDAGLNIGDSQVHLERPAPGRRRIDVEVGLAVIEVKKDLDTGDALSDGEEQLAGYVRDRSRELGQRYVGVLTDGRRWRLYHWTGEDLALVHELRIDLDVPEQLVDWLDGVLALQTHLSPTPSEIVGRLGAGSSAHALELASLTSLWDQHGSSDSSCQLKRELWAKLLTTALGSNFQDEDRLFVEHTYLVLVAETIAHAVVGFDLTDPTRTPESILSGSAFHQAQIQNVVEEDFFDWVIEVPGGRDFVRTLTRRLARFDWAGVNHDVLKVLYESVIDAEKRKKLGEYYTPDWLAERMIAEVVDDSLRLTVLDPACGSGTFLFHLVRRYLDAADAASVPPAEVLSNLMNRVYGMDVHPVAVTLARVTYLLAIGSRRLRDPARPPLAIPVYLGDAVRWQDQDDVLSATGVTIRPADPGGMLPGFSDTLFFPISCLADVNVFDQLVAEMTARVGHRVPGSAVPDLSALYSRYGIPAVDHDALNETLAAMCRLHDEGRDHIWGYYVRNMARPYWLSELSGKVDLLIGNVPWLAYRFMTAGMQALFKARSQERGLWAGAQLVTHQDLSAYFVVRSIELYLRPGGEFFILMPQGVLHRKQYKGFRTGRYSHRGASVNVDFGEPWDLAAIRPPIFPMPAAAIRGKTKPTLSLVEART